MMHQTFSKPMSADYARHVVNTANRNAQNASFAAPTKEADSQRRAWYSSLFKSRRRDSTSAGLRSAAASTATSVATVAADNDNSSNDSTDTANPDALRKEVWRKQNAISQSLPAMLSARTRR